MKQLRHRVSWKYKFIYFSYWQILSVILSTRLGDGVYDTFVMIDETKCPPCSNALCNPSEPPLPRRLNVSKWSNSLSSNGPGKEEVLLWMVKVQLHLTGNPGSFLFTFGFSWLRNNNFCGPSSAFQNDFDLEPTYSFQSLG